MSTQNAVSAESTRHLTADTDEACAGASAADRRANSARVIRVSLFGCLIEMEENASVVPFSILGC